jgi:hypothetical protein
VRKYWSTTGPPECGHWRACGTIGQDRLSRPEGLRGSGQELMDTNTKLMIAACVGFTLISIFWVEFGGLSL